MADTYSFEAVCCGHFHSPAFVLTNTDYDNPTRTISISNLEMMGLESNCSEPANSGAAVLLKRISAYDGGGEKSAVGFRSDKTLPSQVKVVANPSNATEVSNSVFRKAWFPFVTTAAGAYSSASVVNGRSAAYGGGIPLFGSPKRISAFDPVKLAEGQGLLLESGSKTPIAATNTIDERRQTIGVELHDGTDSFFIPVETDGLGGGQYVLAIFNGSGSGKTITVSNIYLMTNFATASHVVYGSSGGIDTLNNTALAASSVIASSKVAFYVVQNSRVRPSIDGGEAVSLSGARSDALSLSGKVSLKKATYLNPVVLSGFQDVGAIGHAATLWPAASQADVAHSLVRFPGVFSSRILLTGRVGFVAPGTASSAVIGTANKKRFGFPYGGKSSGLVKLNPGESLVVQPFGNMSFPDILVRGSITYDIADTGQYPAEPDVKTGVIYGPNRDDFTGTYVGGGGGNTYSRGRVVNS